MRGIPYEVRWMTTVGRLARWRDAAWALAATTVSASRTTSRSRAHLTSIARRYYCGVSVPDPTNLEIAAALDELGDLYELDGAIVHRVVAYRNAAKAVRDAPVSVAARAREGRATELPGIGPTIQEKVLALADDGSIPAAVKLRQKFPAGLIEMTHLPGLGPKRARRLYEELGLDSIEALKAAAEDQRIRTLRGFGAKAEEAILAAAQAAGEGERERRVVLDRALALGEALVAT